MGTFSKNFEDWCKQNNFEQLLKFYMKGKNSKPPDKIGFSSREKVNWYCDVCNMTWKASLNKVTRPPISADCPYCTYRKLSPFYNLAVIYPELTAQWDKSANSKSPEEYQPGSKQKVHWRCENGHKWTASICERVSSAKNKRKTGGVLCPFCSGEKISAHYNLTTEYPEVARQWNYELNLGLSPEDFAPKSNKKVWWTCDFDTTHQWATKIGNRTIKNYGCPLCAKQFKISYPARALFYYLRQIFTDCLCEEPFGGKYKLDIFIPSRRLAIEHDGFYYHSDEAAKKRESMKDSALKRAGFSVLHVRDSKELSPEIVYADDTITYRYDALYKNLICRD